MLAFISVKAYSYSIGSNTAPDQPQGNTIMPRYACGTFAQLSESVTFNNSKLTVLELSIVAKLFSGTIFKPIGTVRKDGQKGRPATIWQVDCDTAAFFEVANANGITLTDEEAVPEPEAATG